ncbi:hypothetical protein DL95DRAFT_399209, partial [Leptodontidium sp. 2 PMI_412]
MQGRQDDQEFVRRLSSLTRMLKLGVYLKKITDGLGLAMVLVGGPHLVTLIQGSDMTHGMFDCLVDCIKTSEDPRLARVSKITETLDGIVKGLLDNVSLPSWEKFQVILTKVQDVWDINTSQPLDIDCDGESPIYGRLDEDNEREPFQGDLLDDSTISPV